MFFYYINEPKSEVSGPKSRFCILSPQATPGKKDLLLSLEVPEVAGGKPDIFWN